MLKSIEAGTYIRDQGGLRFRVISIRKFNPNHEPAGSPIGGEFASSSEASGTGARVPRHGTRKHQVFLTYQRYGREAARQHAAALGLAPGTASGWAATWSREGTPPGTQRGFVLPTGTAPPTAPPASAGSKSLDDKTKEIKEGIDKKYSGTEAAKAELAKNLAEKDVNSDEFTNKMLGENTLSGREKASVSQWGNGSKVTVEAQLKDATGRSIGRITRTLNFATKTVGHDFFRISNTGQGLGKKILGTQMEMYEKLGMKSIEVHANIDVGGYAWAKYGFVPSQRAWDSLRTHLDRQAQRGEFGDASRAMQTLARSSDPKTIWAVADSSSGKRALLGSDWTGKLDLSNSEQVARFKAYVKK